jgi:hypothetical protein
LRTLIEQSKTKKKPFYCCFVDFKKAFDIVPHEVLWQVLAGLGVEGRFLQCLQAMYAKDIVHINHPSEGITTNFRLLARCEARLPFKPPIVWAIFGCHGGALKWQRM